jgi:TerB N-terminal domain
MASILKFIRVVFFYALYFLMCMVVVTVALQSWPDGVQMLFAFGLPIVLVWWQEKRRSRKVEAKALAAETTVARAIQSEPVARVSAHEKRLERERERPREANAIQSSSIAPRNPPTQNYAEIVRAGQTAAPARSAIAKRYENARPTSKKKQSKSRKNGWIPAAETATVAGRDIGGMVYVGTPLLLNYHGYRDKCRAYIDPSLSVARTGDDMR